MRIDYDRAFLTVMLVFLFLGVATIALVICGRRALTERREHEQILTRLRSYCL